MLFMIAAPPTTMKTLTTAIAAAGMLCHLAAAWPRRAGVPGPGGTPPGAPVQQRRRIPGVSEHSPMLGDGREARIRALAISQNLSAWAYMAFPCGTLRGNGDPEDLCPNGGDLGGAFNPDGSEKVAP
jgi:hypothetical protein